MATRKHFQFERFRGLHCPVLQMPGCDSRIIRAAVGANRTRGRRPILVNVFAIQRSVGPQRWQRELHQLMMIK